MDVQTLSVTNADEGAKMWETLAASTNPYIAAGKLIIEAIRAFNQRQDDERFEEIIELLNEVKLEIRRAEQRIISTIWDISITEISGNVGGFHEGLVEYRSLKPKLQPDLIANLLTESALVKQIIYKHIQNGNASPQNLNALYDLAATLLPLRLLMFEYSARNEQARRQLVLDELTDFVKLKKGAINARTTIARLRTSQLRNRVVLIDELGPVYGTRYYVVHDGEETPLSFFPGSGNDAFKRAFDRRDEIVNDTITAMTMSLLEFYDEVEAAIKDLK